MRAQPLFQVGFLTLVLSLAPSCASVPERWVVDDGASTSAAVEPRNDEGVATPVPVSISAAPASAPAHDRLAWWREARFGVFVHWGLYAIPAGRWGDATHYGEWIRTTARIPLERYEEFRAQWNPTKFDADLWARAVRDAGARYMVVTTKHHDGFALFDSAATDWDVGSTPAPKDVMRQIADANARAGLVTGWYHSIMDWHHPDYLPRRDWETRPVAGADFDRYEAFLHQQVSELLTRYGKIGVMWFDGEWESTWNHARGRRLYDLCRRLQPDVIVNNRVDVGRSGMAGLTSDAENAGDFGTPEQEVPPTGLPGIDWESCLTMNRNWGYNASDKDYKSTRELVRTLVDVASKGGNLLLNVGPTAEGEFPPEALERLREIGAWMRVNGTAIHGTHAAPIDPPAWGRLTAAGTDDAPILYAHVFDAPSEGHLVLGGLGGRVRSARVLGAPSAVVAVRDVERGTERDVELSLGPESWDSSPVGVTVIELRLAPRPGTISAGAPQRR